LSRPRARLQDIADLCGVGIATVDRVLNERGNVSEKTAEKVLNVARRLKLKRILPASHHRLLRIEVLLAQPELPLIDRMKSGIRAPKRADRPLRRHPAKSVGQRSSVSFGRADQDDKLRRRHRLAGIGLLDEVTCRITLGVLDVDVYTSEQCS
jgi:hypothetical protein